MRMALGCIASWLLATAAWAQETNVWPPLPEAFSSFGAAVSDDFVYVYGGHVAKTHSYSTEAVTGKFRRLSLSAPAKGWEELPPGPGLQGLAIVAHAGKVYRIGGMQPQNKPGEPANNISVAGCAVYDPKTKVWSALPDLPMARSSHDAVVIGDTIYVAGGWWMKGRGQDNVWHDTMLTLDLTRSPLQWQSDPQPFQRRALNVGAHNGKLYVVCGLTEDGGTEQRVDVYDPATKKWSQGPALPGASRNGFSPAVCACGRHLFANPADGILYRLSANEDAWEEAGKVGQPRIVHRLVPVREGVVLALGGATRAANVAITEAVSVSRSQ